MKKMIFAAILEKGHLVERSNSLIKLDSKEYNAKSQVMVPWLRS